MHIYVTLRRASCSLLPWYAALFKHSVGLQMRNRSLARPVPIHDITQTRGRADELSHIRNGHPDIWSVAVDKAQTLC